MEKRKRNRIQSSWAQQQCVSRDGRTKPVARSNRHFIFQETDIPVEQRKPKQEKTIMRAGTYVISCGSSGEASIQLEPNFIPPEETKWMFEDLEYHIPWEEKDIKVQGQYHKQPRLTAWFGDFPYTYSGLSLKPFQWSPLLNALRERIFNKTGLSFNSMLANLYRNEKDSVDWHSDDEDSLGDNPTICSLSFGVTRNFEMRKKPEQGDDYSLSETIKVPLPSGSLLIMSGAIQSDWQFYVVRESGHLRPELKIAVLSQYETTILDKIIGTPQCYHAIIRLLSSSCSNEEFPPPPPTSLS